LLEEIVAAGMCSCPAMDVSSGTITRAIDANVRTRILLKLCKIMAQYQLFSADLNAGWKDER
jgi:hypothetical protein